MLTVGSTRQTEHHPQLRAGLLNPTATTSSQDLLDDVRVIQDDMIRGLAAHSSTAEQADVASAVFTTTGTGAVRA